jgi:hypothetical protein
MKYDVPEPMKLEHDELHAQLAKATKERGALGVAARGVAAALHSHFVNEEVYAIPPLGLLPQLAAGEMTEEMKGVLAMTEKLKSELPQMIREHKEIVGALQNFVSFAKKAKRPAYVRFSEKLRQHAQMEEEVTYPAAILVGEYIKLKAKN